MNYTSFRQFMRCGCSCSVKCRHRARSYLFCVHRVLRPSYDNDTVVDLFRVLDANDTRRLCIREFLQLADLVRLRDRAKLRLKRCVRSFK